MKPADFYHYVSAERIDADRIIAGLEDFSLAAGAPSGDELKAINGRVALTPQRAEDLFVWALQISSTDVDSHGTWMHRSSLDNYEAGANRSRGYPYLRHHNTRGDEMGRVFQGVLVAGEAPPPLPAGAIPFARDVAIFRDPVEPMRLIEKVFTRRDLAGATDLLARLESGISASNSIGFGVYTPAEPGSMLECDICLCDLFEFRDGSYLCPHIPGYDYEVPRGDGDAQRIYHVVATAAVINARQREASGVYLGSTPGTYTLAQRVAALYQDRKVSIADARRYEEVHHLERGFVVGDRQTIVDIGRDRKDPDKVTTDLGSENHNQDAPERGHDGGGDSMADKTALDRVRELLGGDQDRLANFELADGEKDPIGGLYRVLTGETNEARKEAQGANERIESHKRMVAERIGAQEGEVLFDALDRVKRLADLGAGARDRLVDELVRQMSRAEMEFDEAEQRTLCERLTIEHIEAQTAMYKKAADDRLTSGRLSTPQTEKRTGSPGAARLPDPALVR